MFESTLRVLSQPGIEDADPLHGLLHRGGGGAGAEGA